METYLTQIAEYLLTQSWQIAVLVVVVAAATFALRNRSAHVRYLLWLIVLAKCLTPPLLEVPLAVLPQKAPASARLVEPIPMIAEAPPETPRQPKTLPLVTRMAPSRSQLGSRQWLAVGWLAGVLAFACIAAVKAWRTVRWLHRDRRPLAQDAQAGVNDLLLSLNLRRLPKMWLIEGIGQPFVWGAMRGDIYLPASFLRITDDEHRRHVLGHELSHVMRYDAVVNLLQTIAQAIMWFNPFVWWANKKIRAEREKCCDEMAIARLNTRAKDYSRAIVETLVTEYESTRPIPSLAVAGPVKNIEERINIMLKPGKRFHRSPGLAVILGIFVIALLTVPTALVLTARAKAETTSETAAEPGKKASGSLVEAALSGDVEEVKRLIASGEDVNATSPQYRDVKYTPLMAAANRGHAQVVQVLLDNEAEVNATDFQGWTALYYAFWTFPDEDNEEKHKERAQLVKALIAAGADVNKLCQGTSPLLNAITTGTPRLGSVEALLDAGADIHFKDNRGLMPLYWAAFAGHRDVLDLILERGDYANTIHLAACRGDRSRVQVLLEEGTDVNTKDEFGCTPLHWAVRAESPEVARLLIAKGADIDVAAGPDSLTPLMAARELPVIELLVSEGADVGSQENRTKLHDVCSAGHMQVVKFLIDKGADIHVRNRGGATPLWVAAASDQKEIVELLLERGADTNAPGGRTRSTPLWIAARNGNKETVALLIEKGANLQTPDSEGRTPFAIAKQRGHTEIAGLLRQREADNGAAVAPQEFKSSKTLHQAAADGDIEQVKLLIRNGADVNATVGKHAKTPLIDAASHGHADIVKVLLANGAKVDMAETFGRTPLIHAIHTRNSIETVRALVSAGADVNKTSGEKLAFGLPLNSAIFSGKLDVAKVLLDAGADVDAQGFAGYSPLHHAAILARRRNHEMLELLLSRKAENVFTAACKGDLNKVQTMIDGGTDVNVKDAFGVSLLHWAAAADSPEVAEFLIAKGADVNAKSRLDVNAKSRLDVNWKSMFDDRAPLMGAHTLAVIELLISKGADVNDKQANGLTRLHLACNTGDEDVADFLIRNGADVNVKGPAGLPPLWPAVSIGHANVAELLIASGADVNFKSANGNSPLWAAASHGHAQVVELLIAKGADINASNNQGDTALSAAGRRKHADVVDILLKHGAKE